MAYDFVQTRIDLRAEIEQHDNEFRDAMRAAYAANTDNERADALEWARDCQREAERCRSQLASLAMCF